MRLPSSRFLWALIGLILMALASNTVQAQKFYKWTDADGNVQYTQSPPPEGTDSEQRVVATSEVSEERRKYCAAIHSLAHRLAGYNRSGMSLSAASDAMRQFERREGVNVDDIALRELVNFVFSASRRDYDTDIAGRALDACLGGSFGKLGRKSLASAPEEGAPSGGAEQGRTGRAGGRVTGTGWVTHGLIATNYHVVNGKDRIRVRFADGHEVTAFVGESDKDNDVALLRVSGALPTGLPLAATEAGLGAEVFTLGYPHTEIMGNNAKLSTGIVSSTTGLRDDPRLYQISVPVQAGNSGGPLLNRDGEVVGLVTAKLSAAQVYRWTGDLPQNVNYAVKVSFLNRLLQRTSAASSEMPAQTDTLEHHAARIGPSVVLVIAE
jgi:S1-C subfamily serine protease